MFRAVTRIIGSRLAPVPAVPKLDPRAALLQLDAERTRVQRAVAILLDRRAAALLADDDNRVDAIDHELDQLHRELERGDLIERRLLDQAPNVPETTL